MADISAEIVSQMIDEIYSGVSVKSILDNRRVNASDFFKFLYDNPELNAEFLKAQQARGELMADEIVDIADNETDHTRARNRIDSRKWYASRIQPQKWGEKIDIAVHQQIDIRGALDEARSRVLPVSYQKDVKTLQVIDVTQDVKRTESDYKSDSEDTVELPKETTSDDIYD